MQTVRKSPVFTVGLQRIPKGEGFYFHIEPMDEMLSEDLKIAVSQMNTALEMMIRKMPTQYLWGYNRYKTPWPQTTDQ